MTQAKITKLIRSWQKFLGLDHWNIEIDFDEPALEGENARVWRTDCYDEATIYLGVEWPSWDERFANKTIVHELLHLTTRDLEESFRGMASLIHPDVYAALHVRFEHEMEGVVDRLAERLVELTYS